MLPVEPGPQLPPASAARYSRQTSLPGWGVLAQRRLAAARVLVVGAGGLGSPVLLYLAGAGVGVLGVVDDDVVAESNLHRQLLHDTLSVGRAKVESAALRVEALNPEVRVVRHQERLTAATVRERVRAYDVVVDGTDNFETHYLLADACVLEDRPLVWGSVLGFDGRVSVFALDGPCLRCLFPEPPAPGEVPSCADGGVLGVVPGAVGMAQATETLKLLSGVGEPLVGRLGLLDALRGEWSTLPVGKDPGCRLCGPRAVITEVRGEALAAAPGAPTGRTVGAAQLADWLQESAAGRRDLVVVDVREQWETTVNHIPGAVDVPVADVAAGALTGPGPYVLYCRSGVRSAAALASLLSRGVDAYHLDGGINAWVAEVDPSQPTY